MECLVDIGKIVRVSGVSPRDCAQLALLAEGRPLEAEFPIDVIDLNTGEHRVLRTPLPVRRVEYDAIRRRQRQR